MERTPNDERFHVVVAVSPTPGSLDGEISSQLSRRSLVGGSWVEGPPFSVQGYVMSLFFWGNVPNGSKRGKKKVTFLICKK